MDKKQARRELLSMMRVKCISIETGFKNRIAGHSAHMRGALQFAAVCGVITEMERKAISDYVDACGRVRNMDTCYGWQEREDVLNKTWAAVCSFFGPEL